MNKTERALWARIRPHLPGRADRVENIACPGFPDVSGTALDLSSSRGGDYWIELKVSKNLEGNFSNEAIDSMLEGSQRAWLIKRVPNGAVVFILIGYKKGIVVYRTQWLGMKPPWLGFAKLCDLTGTLDESNVKRLRASIEGGL